MNTTRNMTFENTTSGMGILYQSGTPSPTVYAVMAAVMSIVLLLGLLENFAVLYTFARNKTIRTEDNMLIAGLAISDIGQSVLGVPFVVLAAIFQQWIFGNFMCQYYGFITTSLGLSQITLLTFIALERYFINIRHVRKCTNTKYKCRCVIVFCFLYGFAWGSGPVFGWSSYKLEAIGIACSVSWEDRTLSSISFTVCLFIFGWFLPLILIAFGYMNIARLVLKERIRRKRLQNGSTHRLNWEKRVSITIFMMIGAFILSWCPYSAVSLWSAFSDTHSIPVWLRVAPALFAKSSIIWNPIIYVCRNGNFRHAVFNSMPCFMLVKTQCGNTVVLARTKTTGNETTSIHTDIKSKLNKIKSETAKAFKKERMYNFKNKKVTLKIKETSKPFTSKILRTNQETITPSRKINRNSFEWVEPHCKVTKSSPTNHRHNKFSVFRKRGLLEKVPEYESDRFSNHVQRCSYKRIEMLSHIRKYDSNWRQSNKLQDKQTQTDEFPWCLERTTTAEKGLQTDKANWTNPQTLGVRTDEMNDAELAKTISLTHADIKPCVRVSNSFNDSQKVSKKPTFQIDSPQENIIQTIYATTRHNRKDLQRLQNGKSKSTTALERIEPFGNCTQNRNCDFTESFLHPNKVRAHRKERESRSQPNVREFNSPIYNDITDFNFAHEKAEIISAWRHFDDLQNKTNMLNVCQYIEESSHPERKTKLYKTDTHISARGWRASDDFDSNIPLLSDNTGDIVCSDIF